MYNELIAIAQVDVSVNISATFGNDNCSVEISMMFRIDIFIFANVLPDYSYSGANTLKKYGVDDYVSDKTYELKKVYDDWKEYLEKSQSRTEYTIFDTMEELQEELKKVCIEQVKCQNAIEKIIAETYDNLEGAMARTDDDKKKLLKLLSNCYQLIRDLSVTFHFGGQILELAAQISPEAEKIRKKVLKDYEDYECMPLIVKRRQISEEIMKCKEQISDVNADLLEKEREVAEFDGQQRYEMWKVEQKEACKSMFEEAVRKWNQQEVEVLGDRKEIISKDIDKVNSEIESTKNKRNLFNKKKVDGVLAELEDILKIDQNRTEQVEKDMQSNKVSVKYEQVEASFAKFKEAAISQDDVAADARKAIPTLKEKLDELQKQIDNYVAQYENIVKEFEKC